MSQRVARQWPSGEPDEPACPRRRTGSIGKYCRSHPSNIYWPVPRRACEM